MHNGFEFDSSEARLPIFNVVCQLQEVIYYPRLCYLTKYPFP